MAGDPSSEGVLSDPASGDPTRPLAGGFTVAGQRRSLTGLRWTSRHGRCDRTRTVVREPTAHSRQPTARSQMSDLRCQMSDVRISLLPIATCQLPPRAEGPSLPNTPPMPSHLRRIVLIAVLTAAGVAVARHWKTETAPKMRGSWTPV